jgi:hypothetical protein
MPVAKKRWEWPTKSAGHPRTGSERKSPSHPGTGWGRSAQKRDSLSTSQCRNAGGRARLLATVKTELMDTLGPLALTERAGGTAQP